jgi:hypothetical protein
VLYFSCNQVSRYRHFMWMYVVTRIYIFHSINILNSMPVLLSYVWMFFSRVTVDRPVPLRCIYFCVVVRLPAAFPTFGAAIYFRNAII